MPPNLYIIAGPNGAGKSLFSSSLVKVDFEVFDGDKHTAALKALYPETGSDILENRVNEYHFREAKDNAIRQKGSFAFETNFSSDDPTMSLREFKAAGYKCHLIFMGMPRIEQCMQRVLLRIKAGGHKVSGETIEYNFIHGYKNLYKHFRTFDSVTLMDSAITQTGQEKIPSPILEWNKGKITLSEKNYPDWVAKFITTTELQQ